MQPRADHGKGDVTVAWSDDLTIENAAAMHRALVALAGRAEVTSVRVDFAKVRMIDSIAAAAVLDACEKLEAAGKEVDLLHRTRRQMSAFALVPALPSAERRVHASSVAARIRDVAARWASGVLEFTELVIDTIGAGATALHKHRRARFSATIAQAVHLGVNAWLIVGVLTFLTGVILAFQSSYQLRRFGAEPFMAEVVGLGMVREFSPLMTAIILAGRSGAAMTAEIGTMSVREELDALRTFGIDLASFLVLPRIGGITLTAPALTVLSMSIGIGAGIAVARVVGLPATGIYLRMRDALSFQDFWLGLSKSVLFAWIIGFTGCFLGVRTRGGVDSVGRNTTTSVVISIFLIVATDSIVTTMWTRAGYGEG